MNTYAVLVVVDPFYLGLAQQGDIFHVKFPRIQTEPERVQYLHEKSLLF